MKTEVLKLEHFKADIMREVSEMKRNIETQSREKLDKEFQEKELRYLEEAYTIIQQGLKKVDREKTEVISKTQMENKIKLLNKRKEIIDTVFKKAKEQILEYTKTEKYKTELLEKIRKHMEYIGPGDYIIYLNYKDKDLYSYVQNEFKDAKVFIERKYIEMLGGCKLHNKTTNVYLDDSLAKRLEEEQEEFLQYCGIEIEEKVGD